MTKRKLIYFFFTFIVIAPSYTQGFTVYGNPYLGINSYDGTISNEYYSFVITENWGTPLYEEEWRVTVRLTGDIVSLDGTKVFPSNKVGLILASTGGEPSSIPDVSEISLPYYPVMLNGMQEIDLVNGANVALSNWDGNNFVYYQFRMDFRLVVIGGGYLDLLDDDIGYNSITYSAPFEFKAYIGGEEFTIPSTYNNFQVHKLSSNQSYSILVAPADIDLEFNAAADYANGKNITFSNAVTVTSNVAYQLRVSSIYPNFSSASGHTLPLDMVRVQLSGDGQTTSPMALSDAMVTLLQGTETGGGSKVYDLTLSTLENDARILNLPTDQYSTQVLFEITPQ